MNLKLVAILIVVFGVLSRLLPHHPNVVPITALCLFAGAYLPKKFAFLPILALFISDYFIGFYGIDMFYVYGSFLIISFLGINLKSHKSTILIVGSSLVSSIFFFIITNLGVWAPPNNWYTHDMNGLIKSYTLALPFFKNTLIGDLGYTVILFVCYELVEKLSKEFLPRKLYQLLY